MSICKLCVKSVASSREHVIPSALGGVLEVGNVLCRDCNSKCGAGIDAKLVKAFDFARMLLDIKGDRRQTVTVRGRDPKIGDVILESGGKLRSAKRAPELIGENPDGSRTYRVADESEARHFVKALRRENPTLRVRNAFIVHRFGDTTEIDFSLGNEDFYRSCVKSVLTLLSVPRWNVFDIADEQAWRYVNGAEATETAVQAVLASSTPIWTPTTGLGQFFHSISVQSQPPNGALRAEVRFFGGIPVAIELGNAARTTFRFGYAVDPFTGRAETIDSWDGTLAATPAGITAETQRTISQAITDMAQFQRQKQNSGIVRSLSKTAIDDALADSDEESSCANVVAMKAAELLAERFMHYKHRKDWEESAPSLTDELNGRKS